MLGALTFVVTLIAALHPAVLAARLERSRRCMRNEASTRVSRGRRPKHALTPAFQRERARRAGHNSGA